MHSPVISGGRGGDAVRYMANGKRDALKVVRDTMNRKTTLLFVNQKVNSNSKSVLSRNSHNNV